MTKTTAKACSNIALVKYWGKQDAGLRLPVNSSIAVALDKIFTITTVEFSETYTRDIVEIDGDIFDENEASRVRRHLDLMRKMAGISLPARVVTKNNFPKGVGAASSASGFAALSVAATKAVGLKLSEKELSILARQGSGSASRSIPGKMSVWRVADKSEECFAEPVDFPESWQMRVLLVLVGKMGMKKVGSTQGMKQSRETSPYFKLATIEAEKNVGKMLMALRKKNWKEFGKVIEDECFRLHTLCMTTTPSLLYWTAETVAIFQKLYELREQGIEGFFTVDAGPHVHVVCKASDVGTIRSEIEKIVGVNEVVECGVGEATKVINKHLF